VFCWSFVRKVLPFRPFSKRHLGLPGAKMPSQPIYKVIFHNGGQVYEVFARQIYQSDMWGFVEVEELVFGERSQILVDPGEEKLKNEFSGVKRSYIPLQAIIRIDEVEKEGAARISDASSAKISPFPVTPQPIMPSTRDE
jgi:hypothetical protein